MPDEQERRANMGTYLNPGKESYQMAVDSEIFVDKSEMIQYLNSVINTSQRFVSVSRPRRFGKTMAADMICAYYDRKADGRGLFEKRRLAQAAPMRAGDKEIGWDRYLGQFDVIRLVMTDFIKEKKTVSDGLALLTTRILAELAEAYPEVKYDPSDLFYSMDRFYQKNGHPFVIVLDEWDAVFRVRKNDKEGQTEYLDFLRDWLKDKPYIALAYMTGILPIKKYGKHSALNMFTEYSMTSPKGLAGYVGFTEEDVQEICREKKLNFDPLKEWYDGYRLSNRPSEKLVEGGAGEADLQIYDIYCPFSVVNAGLYKKLENYWNKTENFEALAEYIRKDYDGLKGAVALLMDGGRIRIDTSSYQNDMTTFQDRDDVLSLLIHLGYLGYDDETGEVFIPNKEILDEFRTSTKTSEWTDTFRSFEISQELLKATWDRDADKVAELVERAHDKADNKTYNDEAALSYAIRLAYFAAERYYTMLPETDSGKGYADLMYLPSPRYPDKPALVIELKYNKDADGAIAQIKRRDYPDRLEHYKGNILLVGINYDRDLPKDDPRFKHHACAIEEA